MPESTSPATASPSDDDSVFLSYARADDERPPFNDTAQGWVTFFWHQLRWELTNRGAKRAKLWRDRYEIDPTEQFTQKIEVAVKAAKVVLPVFSSNWAKSDWCRREIETFDATHPDAGDRIVAIFKDDLDRGLLPTLMQGERAREGFRFFEFDKEGQLHEFYWRGLKDSNKYEDLVRQIAFAIVKRLGGVAVQVAAPPHKGAAARTVFLAYAAHDLRDARQRLVNDLQAAGFDVVPRLDEPPETAAELEEVVRDGLIGADLVVHLLGGKLGVTPEGGAAPLVDLQVHLVRNAAGQRQVPRILWAPRWLPGEPQAKRDPFEVARRLGDLRAGEEVYGAELTDLSQWIRRRLEPPVTQAGTPGPPAVTVASGHVADDSLATKLANLVQGLVPSVTRVLAGTEALELDRSAIVLIPWGDADLASLETLLAKIPRGIRIHCLRLPGGDEAAKTTFFKEGVLVDPIDALPAGRREARELLEQLEIVEPTRNAR